ncbi:L,D-transpeptidase family protein [Thorsellia anophelis]|uniref:L,D-transpeptidase YcfS n=1 Tax=Thorsellia anophelis DSM 18579 TaxID=1123402 RepID=A0A1I0DWR6_9GAMM|nr:L,D-transpeptidase family protein [Thorsellia anophelis]SET36815.1 L,D-transpeptidase YcfS [Thorsellia anophelis DSM 18579]
MNRILSVFLLFIISALGFATSAHATEYPLPPAGSRLIGENIIYTVPADSKMDLETIADKFKVGFYAMLQANPDIDAYLPRPGSQIIIPHQIILPDTKREGIVVNLAEMRLYHYPKGKNTVIVYPIGVGQQGINTPLMTTTISQKIPNPTWTPTPNIRKRYAAQGITLPAVWPAGPDNPMGEFALRLAYGSGTYLIHGTNADFGIGLRVSSGCIRLRPNDIKTLFQSVDKGTRVQILDDAIKVTVEPDGRRYVEVHEPLTQHEGQDSKTMPIPFSPAVRSFATHPNTDAAMFDQQVVRRSGLPTFVGRQ